MDFTVRDLTLEFPIEYCQKLATFVRFSYYTLLVIKQVYRRYVISEGLTRAQLGELCLLVGKIASYNAQN